MPIALVDHAAAASPDTVSATTPAIDTTGASLLVMAVASSGFTGTPTFSDNKGNTWNLLTDHVSQARSRLAYATNVAGKVGAGHTFSVSRSVSYPGVAVLAFSGAHATAPLDQQNGAAQNSGSSIQPGSITPTQDDCVLVCGLNWNEPNGPAIDSGFTIADFIQGVGSVNYGIALAYLIQTAAAAKNPTWSWSGSQVCAAAIASFFPSAAARFFASII